MNEWMNDIHMFYLYFRMCTYTQYTHTHVCMYDKGKPLPAAECSMTEWMNEWRVLEPSVKKYEKRGAWKI